MKISKLQIVLFRNHQSFNLTFDNTSTVIVAPNGSGKTNILESINLLAMGESFREAKPEEMISINNDYAHVGGKLETDLELRVTLTRGFLQGKKVNKKKLIVNGVSRSKANFIGNIQVVSFLPEDLRIVEGSPARRRKFLDQILIQIDRQYFKALTVYTKAIRHRNKLLQMIKDGKAQTDSLLYWNELVVTNGEYINQKRSQLIETFNSNLIPLIEQYGLTRGIKMIYDHSIMSEERLNNYKVQEMSAGYTLVGPHRDDFQIEFEIEPTKFVDINNFGSRGQQRMAVLWLKLQSLLFLETQTQNKPILLLDDIFSELDHTHRHVVYQLFGNQQTIATTAEEHFVEGLESQIIRL